MQHKSGFKLIHVAVEHNRTECAVFLRNAGCKFGSFADNHKRHVYGHEHYWDETLMRLVCDESVIRKRFVCDGEEMECIGMNAEDEESEPHLRLRKANKRTVWRRLGELRLAEGEAGQSAMEEALSSDLDRIAMQKALN